MKVSQPEFGERLRTRRLQLGLSQKAVGGDVVTASYISLLERGDRVPTLDVVVQLAKALDTTVADVIGSDVEELLAGPEAITHEYLLRQLELRGYTESGDLGALRVALRFRMDQLRERGNEDRLLEAGIQLSGALQVLQEHGERLELIDELLELPLVRQTEAFRLPLMTDRMSTLRELNRLADARVVGWQVLEIFTSSPMAGGREHVRALGVFGSVLCELQEFDMAATVIGQMMHLADNLGQTGVTGRACWLAALAYARMGELEQAATQLERARRSLSLSTMPTVEWLRLCRTTASVLLSLGDPEAARDWIQAAEITARLAGLEREHAAITQERARYELAIGHVDTAAELFRSVCEPESALTGLDLVTALSGLTDALQQLGRLDEAIDVLRRTARICDETGSFRQAAEAWRRVDELGRMAKPVARRPAVRGAGGRGSDTPRPSGARGDSDHRTSGA